MIFDLIHKKDSSFFVPGKFASCGLFFEAIIETKAKNSSALKKLFEWKELKIFTCHVHPKGHQTEEKIHDCTVFTINKNIFDANKLDSTSI